MILCVGWWWSEGLPAFALLLIVESCLTVQHIQSTCFRNKKGIIDFFSPLAGPQCYSLSLYVLNDDDDGDNNNNTIIIISQSLRDHSIACYTHNRCNALNSSSFAHSYCVWVSARHLCLTHFITQWTVYIFIYLNHSS